MRAMLTAAGYELLSQSRRKVYWTAIPAILFVILAAFVIGLTEYRSRTLEFDRLSRNERQLWLQLEPTDPHVAGHIGTYAFRPPSPYLWFDPGIDQYAGSWEHLEAHRPARFRDAAVPDEIPIFRLRQFSPGSLIVTWFPLLILILVPASIAAEHESGILAMVKIHTNSPWGWLCGKAIGIAWIPLAGCATALTIVPAIAFALIRDVETSFCLMIISSVYMLAFLSIASWLGLRARSRKAAIVGGLGFWCWEMIVFPMLVSIVLNGSYPVPSGLEIWKQVYVEIGDRHARAEEEYKRMLDRLLEKHGVKTKKDLPVNPIGIFWLEDEERVSSSDRAIRRHCESQLEAQERLRGYLSWFSLSAGVETCIQKLCRSDRTALSRLNSQIENYRLEMNRILNHEKAINLSINEGESSTLPSGDLWKKVPELKLDLLGGLNLWKITWACLSGLAAGTLWSAFFLGLLFRVGSPLSL